MCLQKSLLINRPNQLQEEKVQKLLEFIKKKSYKDERWSIVPDTSELNYVSDYGRVISIRQNSPIILKQQRDKDGYSKVSIRFNDKQKFQNVSVHRLVAMCFLDNPEGKPIVHHIDGNPQNNNYNNLKYLTHEEHVVIHNEMKNNLQPEDKIEG